MFRQIFLFEIKYRLKRPATYIYFFIFFLLGLIAVGTGSSPASEKVFHNSPWVLGEANTTFSMFMLIVCSAIMGVPLYRDIEHLLHSDSELAARYRVFSQNCLHQAQAIYRGFVDAGTTNRAVQG